MLPEMVSYDVNTDSVLKLDCESCDGVVINLQHESIFDYNGR